MREYLLRLLKPGDILFYSSNGFIGKMIKIKTASEWTHVALYIGNGMQREFRETVNAQEVPLRLNDLAMIKTPTYEWNREKSDAFWEQVKDWKYDYLGLFWSFYARQQGRNNDKMFCSEYVARDAEIAGEHLFSDEFPADGADPGDIGKSTKLVVKWMAKDGHK